MSIVIALLGLGLLVFVHECGHFFASLAVGLRPVSYTHLTLPTKA